jgi:hypothetical protein
MILERHQRVSASAIRRWTSIDHGNEAAGLLAWHNNERTCRGQHARAFALYRERRNAKLRELCMKRARVRTSFGPIERPQGVPAHLLIYCGVCEEQYETPPACRHSRCAQLPASLINYEATKEANIEAETGRSQRAGTAEG